MIPPAILKGVVFLCPPALAFDPEPRGTGFLLRYIEQRRVYLYIATARHVIDGIRHEARRLQMDEKVHLRVNRRDGSLQHIETSASDWVLHPDGAIDVALLPMADEDFRELDVGFFPIQVIGQMPSDGLQPDGVLGIPDTPGEFQEFGVGDEVVVAGLFRNHYGTKRNVPIVRTGNIAAMPEEPVMVEWPDRSKSQPMEAYLIDTRSVRGLSGSPVYVNLPYSARKGWISTGPEEEKVSHISLDTTYFLIGLIHGHMNVPLPDVDFGTEEDSSNGAKGNTGVAIVVPVEKIEEALQHPRLIESRQKDREAPAASNGSSEPD